MRKKGGANERSTRFVTRTGNGSFVRSARMRLPHRPQPLSSSCLLAPLLVTAPLACSFARAHAREVLSSFFFSQFIWLYPLSLPQPPLGSLDLSCHTTSPHRDPCLRAERGGGIGEKKDNLRTFFGQRSLLTHVRVVRDVSAVRTGPGAAAACSALCR